MRTLEALSEWFMVTLPPFLQLRNCEHVESHCHLIVTIDALIVITQHKMVIHEPSYIDFRFVSIFCNQYLGIC